MQINYSDNPELKESISVQIKNAKDNASEIPAESLRVRILRGASWSLTGAIASQGCALLASAYTARVLGKRVFGEFGMIQSTVGTIGVLAGLGLGTTTTKFVAQYRRTDPHRCGRIIGLTMLIGMVSGILAALIVALVAYPLADSMLSAKHLGKTLLFASPILFFTTAAGVQRSAVCGLESFRRLSVVTAIVTGLTAIMILAGAVWNGLLGAVALWVVASVFAFWFYRRLLNSDCRRFGIVSAWSGVWKERSIIWRFAVPTLLSGALVGPVMWTSAALLARQSSGYIQLAAFNAANQWRNLILFVPAAVGQITLPILSNLQSQTDARRYRRALLANGVLNVGSALGFAILISLCSKPLMSIYGREYRSDYIVLVVLSVTAVMQASCGFVGQILASRGRMWIATVMNGAWAGVLLIGSVYFVPRFGAFGLAVSQLVAYTAHLGWQIVYITKADLTNSRRGGDL